MAESAPHLEAIISRRGLPPIVATIALRGGAAAHPALRYRAQAVSQSADGPARTVLRRSGRADLVPLWGCGTLTVFSAADGSFVEWDATADEPWTSWSTFGAAVRSLLTDLWEDEADDADREDVARLLLPSDQVTAALHPEPR